MVKIFDLTGKSAGEVKLPKVFSTSLRADLIQRAFLAFQSHNRQAYAPTRLAGMKTSAHYHGRRSVRHTMMNKEMARLPRSHGSSGQQEMRARRVPQAVSGRKAHPPKVEKVWAQKINKKERMLAIKSAIAATTSLPLVKARHKIPDIELPIIVNDDISSVGKTKDVKKMLEALKLKSDLERADKKKVRPGKGKMRGRKYKKKKSVLIVVSEDKGIINGGKNISGVDVCSVKDLNIGLLAPGSQPGRLTIWSEGAIKKLGEIYG